jgi:hypothetical protein
LERLISLLNELSETLLVKECIFYNVTHGGFIPIQCSRQFDKIYLLNTSPDDENNVKQNIISHHIQHVHLETDVKTLPLTQCIIYSENFDQIDPYLLHGSQPIILTKMCPALFKQNTYQHIFELTNTSFVLCIPDEIYPLFYKEFHYFIKQDKLDYDNLINLCIMVKNGGELFEQMLEKNMDMIDRWTILDTGSTDGTIDAIHRLLVGKKKGQLYEEPFINFRDSRNRCLDLATTTCKYNIMLDDTYNVEGDLRGFLNEIRGDQFADSYSLTIKSHDVEYISNRITKSERRYLHHA